MSQELLQKMRKVNRLLQRFGSDRVIFSDICEVIGDVVKSNAVVVSAKSKILGVNSTIPHNFANAEQYMDYSINDQFMTIMDLKENVALESIFTETPNSANYIACIVPIIAGGQRLGTFLLYKEKGEGNFTTEDLILAEYGATIVAVEMLGSLKDETDEEERRIAIVKSAIGTLSYSELEAIFHIFEKLDGTEGLLIASKIADKVGITRSVIVNALRKFESAGVIESRSLGMKGTYIKVLNPALLDELAKLRK
ncbi:GTP-sensing pleiotropic transcriptional regulator CodY [Sporanaerobium hydrogeniformans]|uniref:GTP-sensing pleiotropic transcriptional regulator CodY n=1 Tax=Sporanaerobium hydrogeniformans TaxID=3072179 RepID=A0AC61DDE7_9FIRM|nr:GTP-sensing pleiotropic transcriptional regulator CodY [Sporanaerobium hydrogeniformans]PHV71103.1 GTP-sensing pleiotropic transcriptional regulator CodY [Sporanaerobium hydrogeniformans]